MAFKRTWLHDLDAIEPFRQYLRNGQKSILTNAQVWKDRAQNQRATYTAEALAAMMTRNAANFRLHIQTAQSLRASPGWATELLPLIEKIGGNETAIDEVITDTLAEADKLEAAAKGTYEEIIAECDRIIAEVPVISRIEAESGGRTRS